MAYSLRFKLFSVKVIIKYLSENPKYVVNLVEINSLYHILGPVLIHVYVIH